MSLTPATFTDPGSLDTHTATVNWGDGSPVQAAAVGQVNRTISASHVYTQTGTFTVTVSVTDDDGTSDSDSFTVVVNVQPVPIPGVTSWAMITLGAILVVVLVWGVRSRSQAHRT